MGVRVVFLSDCLLILSLLKYKSVETFLNKKKIRILNRGSPLNIRVCVYIYIYIYCFWVVKMKKILLTHQSLYFFIDNHGLELWI